MELIDIQNISVRYGEYLALENSFLKVYQDDFLGIIGPNGGGKTTLIKAILGLVPYTGEIDLHPLLKEGYNKIGYLPQLNSFDKKFPISVVETVMSGLQGSKKLWRGYTKYDRHKAMELLKVVGMEKLANKSIGEVSGGQIQRTLLCRAVISDPKLLILDEPANFVDNKFEKELYEILSLLNERMAIVMVSHDLGTITSVVKNIVCVNRHVHRHDSNTITAEQLHNYDCPIQLVYHDEIPHTVLKKH